MNNEWNFKTRVDTNIFGLAKYWGLPDVDIDWGNPQATVNWLVDWDVRERGIRSGILIIKQVVAEINWEASADGLSPDEVEKLKKNGGVEDTSGYICGSLVVDSSRDWKILNELIFSADGCCMPSIAEISFDRKEITVN